MVVPAMVAWKEKDDVAKLIFYALIGIAVIYTLYKLFGAFREVGEKIEKAKDKIVEKAKEYQQNPKAVAKDAVETPTNEFIGSLKKRGETLEHWVDENDKTLDLLDPDTALYSQMKQNHQGKVVPRYVSPKEYEELEAERWNAMAKHYPTEPIKPTVKPPSPQYERHFLPLPSPRPVIHAI